MEVKINVKHLKTDVTAVKFFNKYLLSGVGGCLKVHNLLTYQQVFDEELFQGQKIHGIEVGPGSNIAVFGGTKVAFFKLVGSSSTLNVYDIAKWQFTDWILNLKWLSEFNIALITAHNKVLLWDLPKAEILQRAACKEKCIIYCALLVGSCWSELIALAGTVFQEIVVWSVGENHDGDRPVLHRLRGHNGVIFSIAHDSINNYISTTSDDRSVRVWSWVSDSIDLRHTLFGHRARVWRSIARGGRVISVGEDGLVCEWCAQDGKLLRRWAGHQGGRIWSLDVDEERDLIVTGGGDCGISFWPLEGCSLTPVPMPISSKLIPRQVRLAHGGLTLAVTDSGCILYTYNEPVWNAVYSSESLASYCIMELSYCKQYVAFATIDGSVLVFKIDHLIRYPMTKILDKNVVNGKIYSLHWLETGEILVCGPNGKLEVWTLNINVTCTLVRRHEFILAASKERWVTAATLLGELLVCGDRGGSVHCYVLSSSESSSCQTLARIHGHMGVCSLQRLDKQLVSSGRDGMLRLYDLQLGLLNVVQTDKLPMVWAARIQHSAHGMLVLGFCEVKFVVWNCDEQRTVMEVECGGGHRSWDFLVDDENMFHFIFVKDKSVHSISCHMDQLVKPVLQSGFHTKEIGCMQLLVNETGLHPILVSASEDTTIRLTGISVSGQMSTASILRGHISSVRALATWIEPSKAGALLFSAGGRAQLKVWRLGSSCTELVSHMLRPRDQRSWRDAPDNEPETRYMDLSVYASGADVIVVAGCSDGLLRIFCYKPASKSLDLLAERVHHTRCILKVSHIKLNSDAHVVLTMSTDGTCAFWMMTQDSVDNIASKPFASLSLHQSGINSFDWIPLEADKFLLATGGDDNALVVTLIRILEEPTSHVENLSQIRITTAHSTQITGLKFLDSCLVSAGIDQRVIVWRWFCSDNALTCTLVGRRVTTVADIQGLLMWRNSSVDRENMSACVYGKGLEVMDIELK